MSRPDHAPGVAVDFSPPRKPKRALPIVAIVLAVAIVGALAVGVTQLLLR